MTTTRPGGDFNYDALEAFRSAYSDSLLTPEDLDTHNGLPTENLSNTSPWIEHTGMWKYPSGKGPEPINQPFNPQDHYDSEAVEDDEDDELESDVISDEELDALVDELLGSFDDDEVEYDIDEED